MKVKLEVAYDGTNYCGWQIQKNSITIEEVLNRTLSQLIGAEVAVTGASRTDSGVHAMGNVAVFDTDTRIPAEKISYALNQRLPEDIKILNSCEVPESFHPRFDAKRKTYRYRILNYTFPIPTLRLYSHFFYVPLDLERMRAAAELLVGTHDFRGFCSAGCSAGTTVRSIYRIAISQSGLKGAESIGSPSLIEIEVEGNGFLYNMVRIIAGTLIKTGTGEFEAGLVKKAIETGNRSLAGPTAPARGLTLIKIEY